MKKRLVACLVVFASFSTRFANGESPRWANRTAKIQTDPGLLNVEALAGSMGENQFLNVKDFGAKGDGVADDAAAIQKVLNSAKNSTTVYFPAGVYAVSRELVLPPSFGVRLMGDGNSTVLQAASRMQNLVHIKGPAYRFLMDCMTIDANNMAEVGIRLDGGYYTVFNSLYVTRPRDMGMHAGSLDQYAGNELVLTDFYFSGLRQIDDENTYSKTGVLVQRMSDCILHNGFVRGFVDVGIDLDAPDLLLLHVHVYKLPAIRTKTGIRIQRRGSSVVNCQIDNMTEAYIEMLGEIGVFIGNLFVRTTAVFGHDEYAGVKKTPAILLGNETLCARGVTISGNSFYSNRAQIEYDGPKGRVDGDKAGLISAVAVNAEDVVCVDNAYGDLVDRLETRASGTAMVPAGKSSVFVPVAMLGAVSHVQLTPQGWGGRFWSVGHVANDGFEIRLSEPAASASSFFWSAQSECRANTAGVQGADFH